MALIDKVVSYWKLDEVSGTREDIHGTNDLTDTNTVGSTTGLINNAADFVATNSEYFVSSDTLGGGTFAISLWIDPDRVNVNETILHKSTHDADGDTTGAEYRLLMLSSGNFQYGVGNGTAWVGGSVAHGMSAGTLYHIVLQYTGTAVELYKDGELLHSNTSTFTPHNTTTGLHFGARRRTTLDLYYDGQMDEIAICDEHLTTDEITALYNGGAGLAYPFTTWDGPTFVSAGAIASDITGGASVTPTPPTHQADDILIVAAYNAAGDAMSTATEGWTSFNNIAGTDDIAFFWKRAAGAGTAGPTITAAGTDCFAICYVFRNCITTGTPFEDATNSGDGTNADGTPDSAAITTTGSNRLAACIVARDGSTVFGSGNPPAGWTDGTNNTYSTDGTDVGFNLICKNVADAGEVASVAVGTIFSGGTAIYGAVTLALIPPGGVSTLVKDIIGGGIIPFAR